MENNSAMSSVAHHSTVDHRAIVSDELSTNHQSLPFLPSKSQISQPVDVNDIDAVTFISEDAGLDQMESQRKMGEGFSGPFDNVQSPYIVGESGVGDDVSFDMNVEVCSEITADENKNEWFAGLFEELRSTECEGKEVQQDLENVCPKVENVQPEVENADPEIKDMQQKMDNASREVENASLEVQNAFLEVQNTSLEVQNLPQELKDVQKVAVSAEAEDKDSEDEWDFDVTACCVQDIQEIQPITETDTSNKLTIKANSITNARDMESQVIGTYLPEGIGETLGTPLQSSVMVRTEATTNEGGDVGMVHDIGLDAAKDEWEAVETITPASDDVSKQAAVARPLIEFPEAVAYFHTLDVTASQTSVVPNVGQSDIQPEVERSVWSSIYRRLFGPPQLHRSLKRERDLIFSAAACAFDSSNRDHVHILMSIYRILTGTALDPPRYGNHWDQIGFQGTDPATDLRSAGMLGLLHLLYLVTDPESATLTRSMYKLSQDESQNFPFCLMGLNITCMTLNAMRHGCLNRECNRRKEVVPVVNDYYIALFYHFYHVWRTQNKTMLQSGYVIKDLEKVSLKNSKSLIKQYEDFRSSVIANPQNTKCHSEKIELTSFDQ